MLVKILAFDYIFYHTECVSNKIFSFIAISALSVFFLSTMPATANACSTDGQCPNGDVCQGYTPGGSRTPAKQGTCVAAPKSSTVQCTCDKADTLDTIDSNGNRTAINNGYKCGTVTGTCSHQEEVCDVAAGQTFNPTSPGNPSTSLDSTLYQGIECQSKIQCSCVGSDTIECFAQINQKPYIYKCPSTAMCKSGPQYNDSNFTAFEGQHVSGITCQKQYKCQHPGLTGYGNNWAADSQGNIVMKCPNIEDACVDDPSGNNNVTCKDTTVCSCDNTDGGSKISCSATVYSPAGPGLTPIPTPEKQDPVPNADCGSKQQVCQQGTGVNDPNFSSFGQQFPGIACVGSVTLPPPPSPPCAAGGWSNGQCTTFATGFGSIATDPAGFVQSIFALLLSVSGGVALLLIIRAGYQLLTSQGKPEQLQAGRDQLIAAIVGLVFLIFSLVLLQLIGVDILHLPGFSQ